MSVIRLAEDTIGRADVTALSEWVLRTPRFTKGPLTDEFEAAFAAISGSRYAVAVNSGSSANLVAAATLLYAERVPAERPTVIVPAVSWVTTVTPFLQLGYEVVFCDADPRTLGLDTAHLERLCEQHDPAAVILVHVLGHDSDVDRVKAICDAYDALLIEDTCEAIGSTVGGRFLGTVGAFGTYSFYFGHQLSTIEGGMLVTDDHELAQVARSLRAHGWARDLDPATRQRLEVQHDVSPFESLYSFYYPGFNCRTTDLNAFLGLRQLERLDEVVTRRQANFEGYAARLAGLWRQDSDADRLSSFAYGTLVENREEVAAALQAADVECRPLICGNVARQPFMRARVGRLELPMADRVQDLGLYVPNHPHLTEGDLDRVADVLRDVAVPHRLEAGVTARPAA